jgi:predicted ATPase/DNA-binding CsgD family transcriptional regulator
MSAGLAGRRTGQLPGEVTGFVGREAELAQIAAALDAARLVTVTGPGGVGKTRVALRAAAQVSTRFADGVLLIELSGLRDAGLLANTVAAALGLPESTVGKTGTDIILRHLRDRRMLLILDTCEHVVDACAMLAEVILAEAPGVTFLATSRQPLDVPGENTYPLPPLSVPASIGLSGNAGAPGSGDAVELFAQRAADVLPGFRVTSANRDAVIALCRQLDGIPLAIELAAVRLRALPLEELAQWLDSRLMVVTGSRRGVAPRHQTLRDAIGWSYDLCTPAEQVLWARLSAFAGGFDIDAAVEVCSSGDLTRAEIIETVIGLVDKSVLTREPAPAAPVVPAAAEGTGNGAADAHAGAAPGTRYRLLDTIREFGAEHLAASGAREAIRMRHFARHLAMARRFAEHFVGDDQMLQCRRLSTEHDDIRAALEYALSGPPGDPERDRDGAALAISLWGYWQVSGLISEGRYWLGKVLDKFPGPSAERAWALIVRGYLGAVQGGDEAIDETAEGTRIAEQIGDELAAARGHLYHMVALMSVGRLAEASAAEAEAEPRLRALGDRIGLHTLDVLAGQLYTLKGDVERSLARAEEGLRRFGDTRERWLSSYLHAIIGTSLFHMPGKEMAATAAMSEALRAKYEIGDCVGTACSLEILGWLAARDGRHARAAWLLGAADPLWARAGGRLTGATLLEQQHRDAEAGARAKLGDKRYAALAGEGARRPLDLIVSLAIAGAPELPPEAARTPSAGGLTSREREIAGLVASGLSNREIAERIVISRRTVAAHVEHIFSKLGISSRAQLASRLRDA